jgi:hypothetical protein
MEDGPLGETPSSNIERHRRDGKRHILAQAQTCAGIVTWLDALTTAVLSRLSRVSISIEAGEMTLIFSSCGKKLRRISATQW